MKIKVLNKNYKTDYMTGEKIYNAIYEYLYSLDQVDETNTLNNWEPSEDNAKWKQADGEIWLVGDSFIKIYAYTVDDSLCKVVIYNSQNIESMIKNGIEKEFNKYKMIIGLLNFNNKGERRNEFI